MSMSISVLLQNRSNINELSLVFSKFFNTDYSRITSDSDAIILIDKDDNYIIRVSSKTLKFTISEDKQELVNKSLKRIEEFLSINFKNETIGIKCYDKYKFNLINIPGVNVINL